MVKRVLLCLLLLVTVALGEAAAQKFVLSGTVTDRSTGEPVDFATVVIEGSGQWAVADAKGFFSIKNVPASKTRVTVSSLGYVSWSREVVIQKDISNFKVALDPDNLALEGAVVTAQEDANSATTSRTIDKTALDHVQVMNVADISSLLPGGATSNPSLTSDQQFSIRAGSAESGNASFGTALEVDGVRLSNNASFTNNLSTSSSQGAFKSSSSGNFKGTSTNNIASSNIESVEVITGVPSVEYGDMTSGIVKINTRKGKTPWTVTMSTSPKTKQISVSKGFALGFSRKQRPVGVLNASAEYTRSVSEPMSPYTSYDRRQVSLIWSNLFSHGVLTDMPLRVSFGVTGNLGGLDNQADPDKMIGTFLTRRDNNFRGQFSADWLLSKSWITNMELKASAVYADKFERENSLYHSAVSSISMHAVGQGYYMADEFKEGGDNLAVRIAPGYWYNVMALDDRPLTAKVTLKANWAKNVGQVNNKVKAGVDWSVDKNYGIGFYSEDTATAPTFRERSFREIPAMHNLAGFLEDNFMLHVGRDGRLNLIAGLRWDNTLIPGSAYGVTSSLSPRFNAKYTFFTEKTRRDAFLRELSVRGSWGVAVKQPSFSVLYPTPSYMDINVFTSTADASNVVSRAYYVMPREIEYNADLVWQRNRQGEIGLDVNLGGTKISLAGFLSRTFHAYNSGSDYDRFTYYYTPTSSVQGLDIPAEDRIYTLDPSTGSVLVFDRTGTFPSVVAAGQERKQFITRYFEDNDDNPMTRYGLEWVIDFKRIKSINTSIRLDGNFYCYHSLYTDVRAYSPSANTSFDGSPYKYIGYFYGDNSNTNGKETRSIKTNLTVSTHIPKVRMILSMKLESCLLNYSRSLSERLDGSRRSYVLSDRTDLLSLTDRSVYEGEGYTVFFPDTYCSFDDPAPKPFLDAFKNARQNDPALYADLSKLVVAGTTYSYTFLKDYLSPYFSANFSVTKEIGDLASISFYANNFFNNMGQVRSSRTGTWSSVSSYIPRFYYGLTVRLKFQ
jgi:hypothetical protein